MKTTDYLSEKKYPGRIIGMGMSENGKPVGVYAIMGRSEGSRNRVFNLSDGILSVKPYKDGNTGDASLTLYDAAIFTDDRVIIANGRHISIIKESVSLENALAQCTYEPDGPVFTPRIMGVMEKDGSFSLAIARKVADEAERKIWSYIPERGRIVLIHTYDDDGNPPPSFSLSPVPTTTEECDAKSLAASIWNALDKDNKVSIFVSVGDEKVIINRNQDDSISLKYGLNPYQDKASISITGRAMPVQVLNGRPGYINFMDALSGYALVKDMKTVLGLPAAASFKHVSPTGAAISIPLDEREREMYFINPSTELSDLAVSYIRARGADRMSSFGDFIALSETCDKQTASIISKEVSDGIIAPGYTDEALEILSKKKKGSYPVILIDKDYIPSDTEKRTLYGMTLEESRNTWLPDESTFSNIVTECKYIPESAKRDLIISMLTLKYTLSNSVCYAYNGQTIGVGAGQQSRIHCTRLAGDKADRWNLRKTDKVLSLPFRKGLSRNEKDNIIEQYLSDNPEIDVIGNWEEYFTEKPAPMSAEEKERILKDVHGIALSSDAFFPFGDNIIRAHRSGVEFIAEPGGSVRDEDVIRTADSLGMTMCFTGVRLFLH